MRVLLAIALFAFIAGCASDPSTENVSKPASHESIPGDRVSNASASTQPAVWSQISAEMGRAGILSENVYTLTFPRDDLDVRIDGMDVPSGAGLASVFWFYQCSCGKMSVVGQFVAADYEANDVIDALRAGQIKVASVAPLLLYEKPKLLLIRFQSEGDPAALSRTLREALRWTGKERMPARKLDE